MDAQTNAAAAWWARPRHENGATWIANYQHSLTVRHRTAISQIVGELGIASLFEAGCHCGPNLMRLTEDHPGLLCAGLDVNAEAIAAGTTWAAQRGVADRVTLQVGAFPTATEGWASGSCEAVLTCYSLAYTSPADVGAALYEAGRLATNAVILAEPMALDGRGARTVQNLSGYTEWAHDYQAAVRWVGTLRGWSTRIVPIAPPVDRLHAILVVAR